MVVGQQPPTYLTLVPFEMTTHIETQEPLLKFSLALIVGPKDMKAGTPLFIISLLSPILLKEE